MLDSVTAVFDRIEEARRQAEAVPVSRRASALEFLRAVWANEAIPLHVRIKAAVEALPFEHPKLAAVMNLNGHDFAARLDRALERSGKARPKLIEHKR